MNLDAGKFLEDIGGRYARFYFAAVHELFVATVRGDRLSMADARGELARITRETMGVAEVLGATIMLRAAAAAIRGAQLRRGDPCAVFAGEPAQTIIPRVTLQEALDDMVARSPVTLHDAAERTAQQIAKLYSEGANVAFVRSAEESVTKAAQEFIARGLREGFGEGEAGQRLAMSANEIRQRSEAWSESYARMVFRTNVNTAVTAGRFRQAQEPTIKLVAPAFRFDAVGDSDTRDNHEAADGMILAVDNPAWNRIAPPLGYNCRCQVSHVMRYELEADGRIDRHGRVIESKVPASAFPDPGFRHGSRPDLFLTR